MAHIKTSSKGPFPMVHTKTKFQRPIPNGSYQKKFQKAHSQRPISEEVPNSHIGWLDRDGLIYASRDQQGPGLEGSKVKKVMPRVLKLLYLSKLHLYPYAL